MITHIKDAKFKVIETKIDKLIALAIEKGEQSVDDADELYDFSTDVTYNDINNIRVQIMTAIKDFGVMK